MEYVKESSLWCFRAIMIIHYSNSEKDGLWKWNRRPGGGRETNTQVDCRRVMRIYECCRNEYWRRKNGRHFCCGCSIKGKFWMEQHIRAMHRQIDRIVKAENIQLILFICFIYLNSNLKLTSFESSCDLICVCTNLLMRENDVSLNSFLKNMLDFC